jgi:hypothetical protein
LGFLIIALSYVCGRVSIRYRNKESIISSNIIGVVLASFISLSLPLPSAEAVIKTLFDFLVQNFGAIYVRLV